MTMRDELIEEAALAAWLDYCGVHERESPDYDDDGDFEERRAAAISDWNDNPGGCTHIGADGFRSCATVALYAILAKLETPPVGMLNAAVDRTGAGSDMSWSNRSPQSLFDTGLRAMLATLKPGEAK